MAGGTEISEPLADMGQVLAPNHVGLRFFILLPGRVTKARPRDGLRVVSARSWPRHPREGRVSSGCNGAGVVAALTTIRVVPLQLPRCGRTGVVAVILVPRQLEQWGHSLAVGLEIPLEFFPFSFPSIGFQLRTYCEHVYLCGSPLAAPPIDPPKPLHHSLVGNQVAHHVDIRVEIHANLASGRGDEKTRRFRWSPTSLQGIPSAPASFPNPRARKPGVRRQEAPICGPPQALPLCSSSCTPCRPTPSLLRHPCGGHSR